MRKAIALTAAAGFALSACTSMDGSQRKTAQTTGIGAAVGGLGGYVWSQHMANQRKQLETSTQGPRPGEAARSGAMTRSAAAGHVAACARVFAAM